MFIHRFSGAGQSGNLLRPLPIPPRPLDHRNAALEPITTVRHRRLLLQSQSETRLSVSDGKRVESMGRRRRVRNKTTRAALPLALVHPLQCVKLLAWCAERQDFRQFFVRSMEGPTPKPGDFSGDRTALLEGLLDKYTGRA